MEIEFVVAPGKRKFWKWSDYALADADEVVIVVRPSPDGVVSVSSLIEPLVHALSFGLANITIVLNNMDQLPIECMQSCEAVVRDDIRRIFPQEVAEAVPILSVSVSDRQSLQRLLTHAQSIPEPVRDAQSPFQLCINSVHSKSDSLILGGKILRGSVSVGSTVYLMPPAIPVTVESVFIADHQSVESASAGRVVGIKISGLSRNHLSVGMVLVADVSVGKPTRLIRAKVNFFNLKQPVKAGFSPVINIMANHIHCKMTTIEGERESVSLGDSATVTLALSKTAFAQIYDSANPMPFSRLALRQENVVIGVGVIVDILD